MKIDWLTILLSLTLSLATVVTYDYAVISPKLKASRIEVADIEYILSHNEKLVQSGKLTMESYKTRVRLAEKIISEHNSIILNKYIKIGNKLTPLAFGGVDITEDIIQKLEAIP